MSASNGSEATCAANRPISLAVIRGKVIGTDLVEFGGRGDGTGFLAPDPRRIIDLLPLGNPGQMQDLHEMSFEDILDYLEELGGLLDISTNDYMREARELSYANAPGTKALVDLWYAGLPAMFDRERVRQTTDQNIGIDYLEGWVTKQINGFNQSVRAYGSRALHIVAGNGPVGAISILRGAVTRSDTIIKVPSNDPFTTGAIARTMCDFAPDHPITKHLSVAYWRGGDAAFENRLYQPHNIEKIIAWGGFASVKHVTKYIQPGLELISLDPKRSASIVGDKAMADAAMMLEAAQRIAADMGALNQTACASCRIAYVICGTDDAGIAKLRQLGQLTYDAMLKLPADVSTKPKLYDPVLKGHVDGLRLMDEFYTVIGGEAGEGAVIISHYPEPVEFFEYLADRTVNLIPVDSLDEVLDAVDAYTQTVGIFPDALPERLRHDVALHGGQRLVSLGWALNGPGASGPQDGIEPMRRMCKWIVCEQPLETLKPLWERAAGETAMVA